MCDFGLVLGLAAGAASAAGEAAVASDKQKAALTNYNLQQAANEREFIVNTNAALKDGYQAQLEGDRAHSAAVASGAGMTGPTAGLRVAEQSRQTALSIANAKDQMDGAKANYIMTGKSQQLQAQSTVNALKPNPMSTFMDIASSGLKNYGAFQ
ncbi:hypothetical protein EOA23_12145 [Mesorhizobium sp. M2A.F.Ca.ET.042.01.1.1]|uniref:hypothetical protein n=1 Tax=Mesorhizobium sp. M2A.F.Ca.ET.042.01.1.1 TaxID=2496745 RepID=UPI000FCC60A1|nr:hypothetical protein [Mesorhizobium sp. M2A.F.Ca.ET.042.01.1.1]RUX30380.1 hypothetical protein EOA23_12145 [Mesorhizobium sp. M2A.F.Ca.ET.042.01.1.1]